MNTELQALSPPIITAHYPKPALVAMRRTGRARITTVMKQPKMSLGYHILRYVPFQFQFHAERRRATIGNKANTTAHPEHMTLAVLRPTPGKAVNSSSVDGTWPP